MARHVAGRASSSTSTPVRVRTRSVGPAAQRCHTDHASDASRCHAGRTAWSQWERLPAGVDTTGGVSLLPQLCSSCVHHAASVMVRWLLTPGQDSHLCDRDSLLPGPCTPTAGYSGPSSRNATASSVNAGPKSTWVCWPYCSPCRENDNRPASMSRRTPTVCPGWKKSPYTLSACRGVTVARKLTKPQPRQPHSDAGSALSRQSLALRATPMNTHACFDASTRTSQ